MLSSVLSIIFVLAESVSMLLWLHIGFQRDISESKGKGTFIIMYVLYFYITSFMSSGLITEVLPAITVFLWVRHQFREGFWASVVKYVISSLGMGLIQALAFGIMYCLDKRLDWLRLSHIYCFVSVVSVLGTFAIYKGFRKDIKLRLRFDRYSVLVLLYVVCIMVFIKLDYERHDGIYSHMYIFLFLLLVFFVLALVRGLRISHSLEQKKLELQLREQYEEAYSKLILELRRRQHDYKNQLSALYSIGTSCHDDVLRKEQHEYAKMLMEREQYDGLLAGCQNPILSGYVYTFCNEASRIGINIKPRISCSKREYNIAMHEIIEILGILVNNAIEYLQEKEFENKSIIIDIFERIDKIHIVVSNITEGKSYEELGEMFQPGHSTKGQDRGIGLYSLKQIVKKNKGELLVEKVTDKDINWLKIETIF